MYVGIQKIGERKMTKNDLKSGMFVRISDGRMYLVLRDTGMSDTGTTGKDVLINIHSNGWLNLKNYNEDLTYCCYDSLEKDSLEKIFNIQEVYRAMNSIDLCDAKEYVKIWNRDKTQNKEIKERLLKENIVDKNGNFRDYKSLKIRRII